MKITPKFYNEDDVFAISRDPTEEAGLLKLHTHGGTKRWEPGDPSFKRLVDGKLATVEWRIMGGAYYSLTKKGEKEAKNIIEITTKAYELGSRQIFKTAVAI